MEHTLCRHLSATVRGLDVSILRMWNPPEGLRQDSEMIDVYCTSLKDSGLSPGWSYRGQES